MGRLKTLVVLMSLIATSSFANEITWSSGALEFTSDMCSGGDCANDTLVTTGNISNPGGKALDIAAGCQGLTCVFTGHTIQFTSIGVSIHCDDVKIVGGNFVDISSGNQVVDPLDDGNQGIKIDDGCTLKDVSVSIRGDNSQCVWAEYKEDIEIDGGTFDHQGTGYYSRCGYDAPVIKIEKCEELSGSSQYHLYMHDATIINGPWAGITVQGVSSSAPNMAVAWIEDNVIELDAQNDWHSSYSGLCLSSANPYGVLIRNGGPNCRVIGNTITSGTAAGGCRGIMMERVKGTVASPGIVRGNHIDVHEGPNVEFGETLPVHGLRVRYDTQNLLVDSNTFIVRVDNSSGTDHTGSYGMAVRLSSDYNGSNNDVILRNNTISARSDDASGIQNMAMVFGAVEAADVFYSYNNNVTSNHILYQFTTKNGSIESHGGSNNYIEGDTCSFLSPSAGYITMRLGWLANDWYARGNEMRDVVFNGGASPTDVNFYYSDDGPADIKQTRTVNVYVRGNNNLPVVGATVTGENGYGQTPISGTSSDGGLVSDVVTYYFEANTTSDSAGFNTFTLRANDGTNYAQNSSFTVGPTASGGTDTLDLDVAGTGTWRDTPDPNNAPTLTQGTASVETTPVGCYSGTTTISASFLDADNPSAGTFTSTFKVRDPSDGVTTIATAADSTTGSAGSYTAYYTWDPECTIEMGTYDLYFEVEDGPGASVYDAYSSNLEELTVYNNTPSTLNQVVTVIDTGTTTLEIEVDFSNVDGTMDYSALYLSSGSPPTLDQIIASPTDPDTFSVTGLVAGGFYYYWVISHDDTNTDTTGEATISTLAGISQIVAVIDSGTAYNGDSPTLVVRSDYVAGTVDSVWLVWGADATLADSTGRVSVTSGITDPDTLETSALSEGQPYHLWFFVADQTGIDTSYYGWIVSAPEAFRFGAWNETTAPDDTGWYQLQHYQRPVKFNFTGPDSSILDSIYFMVNHSSDAKGLRLALYDSTLTLIDSTAPRSINVAGKRWWGAALLNAPKLISGANYWLTAHGEYIEGGGDLLALRYDTTISDTGYGTVTGVDYSTAWPNTITLEYGWQDFAIASYGVYTLPSPSEVGEAVLTVNGKVIWSGKVVVDDD